MKFINTGRSIFHSDLPLNFMPPAVREIAKPPTTVMLIIFYVTQNSAHNP